VEGAKADPFTTALLEGDVLADESDEVGRLSHSILVISVGEHVCLPCASARSRNVRVGRLERRQWDVEPSCRSRVADEDAEPIRMRDNAQRVIPPESPWTRDGLVEH